MHIRDVMQQQKHAFKINASSGSVKYFKLVCEDKLLCEFFDHWCLKLSKKRSHRTVDKYTDAVIVFLNYMFEVQKQTEKFDDLVLMEVLENFESYLVFGQSSDIDMCEKAAKALVSRPVSPATVSLYFTGLNNFLDQSENLRRTLLSLQSRAVKTAISASSVPLSLVEKIDTPSSVRAAIKKSSWLAGCINGVMKRTTKRGLAPTVQPSPIAYTDEFGGDEKTFPIDRCQALIESAKNLRDKTLWSLIAATGCRISEAQTMLRSDIEIIIARDDKNNISVQKNVFIVDPKTRPKILKRYISEEEFNALPHKGRADPKTFLIEPFATMFWEYYEKYYEQEKKRLLERGRISDHDFLFRLETTGEPVINSYQTLYDSFSTAAKAVTGESYGFHSLRHMYGYYLKNFCPVPAGNKLKYGMNLKSVQKFMGHKEISSTQRYARDDAIKLAAAHAAMNMERNRRPNFTVLDAKIGYLEQEIERLKASKDKGALEQHD